MRIFISHSTANREIATLLSDYLQELISDIKVFCSALSDTFASGDSFHKIIMNNIDKADYFIPILTEDFYRSKYCLIELGFACGIHFTRDSNTIKPFSLPPIDSKEALKGTPLDGLSVKKLNEKDDIKQLFSILFKKESESLPNDYNEKIKFFIERLQKITSNKDVQFIDIAKHHVDPILHQYLTEGFCWGLNISVISCPNNSDWWVTSDFRYEKLNTYDLLELYEHDSDLNKKDVVALYNEYLQNEFRQKFIVDKKRYMLVNRYFSTKDNSGIIFELKETSWSVFRFFADKILTDERREKYIANYFASSKIIFPNSLCLHLVVLTENNKILITKINKSSESDVRDSWAVSIGEQIDEKDMEDMEGDIAAKWVTRAFSEELDITIEDGHYKQEDIRFMSINLEANVLNFAVCCVVRLRINDSDLTKILRDFSSNRDSEVKTFGFMNIDEVPREMVFPSRNYHPSSHIRMAYAYMYARGSKKLKEELNKLF